MSKIAEIKQQAVLKRKYHGFYLLLSYNFNKISRKLGKEQENRL